MITALEANVFFSKAVNNFKATLNWHPQFEKVKSRWEDNLKDGAKKWQKVLSKRNFVVEQSILSISLKKKYLPSAFPTSSINHRKLFSFFCEGGAPI